jgi:hypothetical protein
VRVEEATIIGTANFSPCGKYRYRLTRLWNADLPPAVVIGANPSTATADEDDATIRLETGILQRWGFGSYVKLNAYGFKATMPKDMWAAQKAGVDIVGHANDSHIIGELAAIRKAGGGIAIAAWGGIPKPDRVDMTVAIARLARVDLYAFGINPSGSPWHPLYKAIADKPVLWRKCT